MAAAASLLNKKLRIGIVACEDLPKWGGKDEAATVLLELFQARGLWNEQEVVSANNQLERPNNDYDVGMVIEKSEHDIDCVKFNAIYEELPNQEELHHFDGFLLSGSHYSVNDDSKWIRKMEEWVRSLKNFQDNNKADNIINQNRKSPPRVVAICFSHQLVNKALGGKVGHNPDGKFLWNAESIVIKPNSSKHPFFEELKNGRKDSFYKMYKSHGESVIKLPPGAVNIGTSATCEHEIVTIGDDIITIQCHPEFSEQEMVDKILPALKKAGKITDEDAEQEMKNFGSGIDGPKFVNLIAKYFMKAI